MRVRRRRHRVVRIGAHNHLEHPRRVFHSPRHRPGDIRQQTQRHHSGAAGESHGRPDPHQRLVRRGAANRIARIAPKPHQPQARGHRCRRAAARSRRHPVQRVRIPRVARQNGVHRFVRTESPLRHVALRQHNGARLLDALHFERVFVRQKARQGQRAVGGLQTLRLEIVFHDDRHAVQRSGQALRGEPAIQFPGLLLRIRIQHHQRIDGRAVLVVRLDPLQVLAHQRAAGQAPRFHGLVHLRNGGFFHFERCRALGGGQRGSHDEAGWQADHQTILHITPVRPVSAAPAPCRPAHPHRTRERNGDPKRFRRSGRSGAPPPSG